MIYTFSPNWYKPQCLHFKQNSLIYCSNYLLYEFNLLNRKVTRELCFRQIAISNQMNHKDIKINAIQSHEDVLVIGLNQNVVILLNFCTFEVLKIIKLDELLQTVEYIHWVNQSEQTVILCNKEGQMVRVNLQDESKSVIQYKHKLSAVKLIFKAGKQHVVCFTKGLLLIFNELFTNIEKVVEMPYGQSILSVDFYKLNLAHMQVAILTRFKDDYHITSFDFENKQDFPLEFKKKVEEIGNHIRRFTVQVYYPKKYAEKIKNNQKASVNIKLLNEKELILTGKFGQIFSIFPLAVENNSVLTIKPFSFEEGSKDHLVWTDSKHYKQIYGIYEHKNKLFMISTDHNLTAWNFSQDQVKYLYSIKFLTSAVSSIFNSDPDPRNVFFLLKDSIVRSCSPLDEGSHFLSEYWKFTKKYIIKKAICHPKEQGILALVTQCNKIQLYDAYEDRLMKIVEINEEIMNVSFELPSIRQELEALFLNEAQNKKVQHVCHFVKDMDNSTILLVQGKAYLMMICNLANKDISLCKLKKERRIERVHNHHFWDGKLLLSTVSKQNKLQLYARFMGETFEQCVELAYSQGRYLFKAPKQSNTLYILNYKGNKLQIYQFGINNLKLQKQQEVAISLPFIADFIHICYEDDRIALYNQRDDLIQIMHLNEAFHQKDSCIKIYSLKTKIQSLFFYLQEYLIVASKDQTIRVIRYAQYEDHDKKSKSQMQKEKQQMILQEPQQEKMQQEPQQSISNENQMQQETELIVGESGNDLLRN